jgi:hypothetical protein
MPAHVQMSVEDEPRRERQAQCLASTSHAQLLEPKRESKAMMNQDDGRVRNFGCSRFVQRSELLAADVAGGHEGRSRNRAGQPDDGHRTTQLDTREMAGRKIEPQIGGRSKERREVMRNRRS